MARPSPHSPLARVQALMARAVMRPLTSGEQTRRGWIDGSRTADVAAGFIKPNDRLSAVERLQIYNQQYWWRLRGAFAEDFHGLRSVLGNRRFDKIATAYLDHCGSMTWTLRDLGSRLEGFLRERPELSAPRTQLALDMVRIEWARILAFDGPELPPIRAGRIADVSPALLRLGLQPYLSLLALRHPIDELLRKLRLQARGTASNAVARENSCARARWGVPASEQPIYLAVHRVDFSVYYKRLAEPAYRLLNVLRAGGTLESACAEAFAESLEPPERAVTLLQEWFADWMRFGWFTKPPACRD